MAAFVWHCQSCPEQFATAVLLHSHTMRLHHPLNDAIDYLLSRNGREAQAGGPQASSLGLLLPGHPEIGHGPLDEQMALTQATRAFEQGQYIVLCDGRPFVDLEEAITLTRRTSLLFLAGVASDVPA